VGRLALPERSTDYQYVAKLAKAGFDGIGIEPLAFTILKTRELS